jgi:hypothetical protein
MPLEGVPFTETWEVKLISLRDNIWYLGQIVTYDSKFGALWDVNKWTKVGIEHLVDESTVSTLLPRGITPVTLEQVDVRFPSDPEEDDDKKWLAAIDVTGWNPGAMWAWTSGEGKTEYYLPTLLYSEDGGISNLEPMSEAAVNEMFNR